MSPNSEESNCVQRELIFAQELKKTIFPLLLDGERWFEVIDIQMTDVQGGKLPPDIFFNKIRSKLECEANVSENYDNEDKDLLMIRLALTKLSIDLNLMKIR